MNRREFGLTAFAATLGAALGLSAAPKIKQWYLLVDDFNGSLAIVISDGAAAHFGTQEAVTDHIARIYAYKSGASESHTKERLFMFDTAKELETFRRQREEAMKRIAEPFRCNPA